MFDAIKNILGSIYACFFLGAFVLGSFYFSFSGQWVFLLRWWLVFVVPWIYVLDRRNRKRNELDMKEGEIQIDSERQAKAINDYLNIPSVKERIQDESIEHRKKRKKLE